MRITNIKQNNNSFQNITRIKSLTNPIYQDKQNRIVDSASAEVAKVLNNLESSVYPKKDAGYIRDFFSRHIPDYNRDKASLVLIQNELYLLTGKDFDEDAKRNNFIENATRKFKEYLDDMLGINEVFLIHKLQDARDMDIVKKGRKNPEFFQFLSTKPIKHVSYDQAVGLKPMKVNLDRFTYFAPKSS